MITRTKPDIQKAISLQKMALTTLERLNSTDKNKYPSNVLVDYYDIIRKLMEALIAIEGVKVSGVSAHYKIINYISYKYNFIESDRFFLQQVRNVRNRISYDGLQINKGFIKENNRMLCGIVTKLLKLLKQKLKHPN